MPNVTAFKHIVCCATIFVLLKQIQLKVIFGNVSVHDNFILSKNLSIFSLLGRLPKVDLII